MHPGRMPTHGSLNHSGHNSLHEQHHMRRVNNSHGQQQQQQQQQQFPFSRMLRNFNNVAQSHPTAQAPPRPVGLAHNKYMDCATALNTPFFMQLQNELSLFPVDFGVDLGSVRAEIDNCKRRYHREVWNVICGKALQSGHVQGQGEKSVGDGGESNGGGSNGSGWKKADRAAERGQSADRAATAERDEESGATGAGKAKRGPGNGGQGSAGPATPSAAGGGQRSEDEITDDEQVNNGEEGGGEGETTDEVAMNENNRALRHPRRQQQQQQQLQLQQQPQQQQVQQRPRQNIQRNRQQSLIRNRQSSWNDEWKNWNNSTTQRSLSGLLKLVGFSDQELPASIIDAATAPAGFNSTATGGAVSTDEDDDDDDDEEESFGRINHSLIDDEDALSSGSSGCNAGGEGGGSRRRRFVPMHCGDWYAGGFGTSELQRQRRQALVKKRQEAHFVQQMRQLIAQTAPELARVAAAPAAAPKGSSTSSSDAKTAPSKQ